MEGTWDLNTTEEDEYNTELVVHNFHPSLTKVFMICFCPDERSVEASEVITCSVVDFLRLFFLKCHL